MCDGCWSRRDVLLGSSAVLAAAGLIGMSPLRAGAAGPATSGKRSASYVRYAGSAGLTQAASSTVQPITVAEGLSIYPRDAWGADLSPKGQIQQPEDVRFLLVHHTASPNTPPAGGTPTVLRETYAFQTSPAKGWPDVCYEFFVDRDGLVWEGRAGALNGSVVADATGGSQGFAQLVCLVGDFTSVLPTPAQQASLVRTLAWLADRNNIDTSPGATTTFVSRGSQRWNAGVTVTAKTISGHRDMSMTACPGNAFYPIVRDEMQALVTAARTGQTGSSSTVLATFLHSGRTPSPQRPDR